MLRFLGGSLKNGLRGKDFVARFGGEEFAAVLPNTGLAGAEAVSEKIRKEISDNELRDEESGKCYGRVSVSIGIAQYRWGESAQDLILRADQALYTAKQQGRNRVEKAAV